MAEKKHTYILDNRRGKYKIYIDGILHLSIVKSNFAGVQSWLNFDDGEWYCIEIYLKIGTPILCEYDDINKWKEILKLINQF